MAEPSLDLLQGMMQQMLDRQQRMGEDITDVKHRLTTLEIQVGGFLGTEQSHYGQTMQRLDGFDQRLARIERELLLVSGL